MRSHAVEEPQRNAQLYAGGSVTGYSRESGIPFALYLYASSRLARRPSATSGKSNDMQHMTSNEAAKLVETFFESCGASGAGLGEQGLSGVMIGAAELFFQYLAPQNALKCSALIYRFREEPQPRVLEEVQKEARRSEFDMGGGALDFQTENGGLYLSRIYEERVPVEEFAEDMKQLSRASLVWGREALEFIASRVFHPEQSDHTV